MYKFTDTAGRTYNVMVDVFAARRVKAAGCPAIETFVQPDHADKWDRVALFDALLAVCQPGKQGVNDDAFAVALTDGDVAEAAAESLGKAVADFLPQRQKSLTLSLMTKGKEIQEARTSLIEKALAKATTDVLSTMTEAQSRLSSGTSPASQESIPPE